MSVRQLAFSAPMTPNAGPGRLITVCGLDGSGKTTTVGWAAAWADEQGIPYEVVKIPSDAVRSNPHFLQYVSDHGQASDGSVDLLSICLLCDTDLLRLTRRTIIPLLRAGTWVICDRYAYSSLAELDGSGYSADDVDTILAIHRRLLRPDLPIVMDLPATVAIERVHQRPDERDAICDPALWGRFQEGFRRAALDDGLVLLDAAGDADDTRRALHGHLEALRRGDGAA